MTSPFAMVPRTAAGGSQLGVLARCYKIIGKSVYVIVLGGVHTPLLHSAALRYPAPLET